MSFSQKVVPVVRDRLLRVLVCTNGWLSIVPSSPSKSDAQKISARKKKVAKCLVAAKQKATRNKEELGRSFCLVAECDA